MEGSVCKMNRPVGETTEMMRALWFRIPSRPIFLAFGWAYIYVFGSADEILHVYWSVCVCVCQLEYMSA